MARTHLVSIYAKNREGSKPQGHKQPYGATVCASLILRNSLFFFLYLSSHPVHACYMHGICMVYTWKSHAICMEHAWYMHGICMEFAWEIHGISGAVGVLPSRTPTAPDVKWRPKRSRTTTARATACSPRYHPEGEVSTGASKLGLRVWKNCFYLKAIRLLNSNKLPSLAH